MGYTHYFTKAVPVEKFNELQDQIKEDVVRVCERYEDILDVRCTAPVVLDGEGDFGYETLVIDGAYPYDMAFCKTARREYDLPVCLVLLLHAREGMIELSSDGFGQGYIEPEWKRATETLREMFGYELNTSLDKIDTLTVDHFVKSGDTPSKPNQVQVSLEYVGGMDVRSVIVDNKERYEVFHEDWFNYYHERFRYGRDMQSLIRALKILVKRINDIDLKVNLMMDIHISASNSDPVHVGKFVNWFVPYVLLKAGVDKDTIAEKMDEYTGILVENPPTKATFRKERNKQFKGE